MNSPSISPGAATASPSPILLTAYDMVTWVSLQSTPWGCINLPQWIQGSPKRCDAVMHTGTAELVVAALWDILVSDGAAQ